MKKTVFFGLLVIILTFSFIGCDNGNESNNDDPSPYAGNWTGIGIDAGGNTVNVILTVYDDNSFVEKIDAFGPMSNWARGNLSVSSTNITLTFTAFWKENSWKSDTSSLDELRGYMGGTLIRGGTITGSISGSNIIILFFAQTTTLTKE